MLFYENDTSARKLIVHYDFHVTVTQFTGSKKKKLIGIELNYYTQPAKELIVLLNIFVDLLVSLCVFRG